MTGTYLDGHAKREKGIDKLLKLVAPGTPLREGINNVLRANTGGLIVIGHNDEMKDITEGGFPINASFTPANLYELAKMDGAIILNDRVSKILIANAQLHPDPKTPSAETGMRHRTAERVARQTGNLVIAVSQRRNIITLYQGTIKYIVRDMNVILAKSNQAIQTLEKYKNAFEQRIITLGLLEYEEVVSLEEVISILHNVEMILRNKNEILEYINELGSEGRLLQLQLTELLADFEEEVILLMKDYHQAEDQDSREIYNKLQDLSKMELLEDNVILKLLGYSNQVNVEDIISPRGYRILHKISRLPPLIIENIVERFDGLREILHASLDELDDVEGVGEVRAKKIKDGLRKVQEQLFINRYH